MPKVTAPSHSAGRALYGSQNYPSSSLKLSQQNKKCQEEAVPSQPTFWAVLTAPTPTRHAFHVFVFPLARTSHFIRGLDQTRMPGTFARPAAIRNRFAVPFRGRTFVLSPRGDCPGFRAVEASELRLFLPPALGQSHGWSELWGREHGVVLLLL